MNGGDFLRYYAEHAYDDLQLALIASLQQSMIDFAMNGWRSMKTIEPPTDVPLICACEEGVVIMTQTEAGEWRTAAGVPHKPPRAWMPCPVPPSL